MTLQFRIITPDRIFLDAQSDEILLPTNTGQIGILTGHAPLITALDIGVLFYRSQPTNTSWTAVALMGGFAFILNDQITILVNEADNEDTIGIDSIEASQNLESAQAEFRRATNPKQKVSANFALKRANARYQVLREKRAN